MEYDVVWQRNVDDGKRGTEKNRSFRDMVLEKNTEINFTDMVITRM